MKNNMTGSQRRAAKRINEPAAMTRAQACRVIAGTTEQEIIKSFVGHGSKAVRRYSAHKSELLTAVEAVEVVVVRKPLTAEQKARKNAQARARRAAKKTAA